MVVAWNATVEQSTEGSNPSLSSIYLAREIFNCDSEVHSCAVYFPCWGGF